MSDDHPFYAVLAIVSNRNATNHDRISDITAEW